MGYDFHLLKVNNKLSVAVYVTVISDGGRKVHQVDNNLVGAGMFTVSELELEANISDKRSTKGKSRSSTFHRLAISTALPLG